ncbi:hypothetical protein DB775_04295, partial [Xanthomonas perforans]
AGQPGRNRAQRGALEEVTTLKHADDSMTETGGRAVRYQPSIMRQHDVRINLLAVLSHADPCTTLAWLG